MAVIALGALVLPSSALVSPFLIAPVATLPAWLSGSWRTMGFGRPARRAVWWLPTALVLGLLWQYAASGFIAPLAMGMFGASAATPAAAQTGQQSLFVSALAASLVHPLAKGLAFRGFLLSRLERLFGPSLAGLAASIIFAAIVFGLANAYQGAVSVVVSSLTGAGLCLLYYWAGRSLWASMLAHAVYNTIALTLLSLSSL